MSTKGNSKQTSIGAQGDSTSKDGASMPSVEHPAPPPPPPAPPNPPPNPPQAVQNKATKQESEHQKPTGSGKKTGPVESGKPDRLIPITRSVPITETELHDAAGHLRKAKDYHPIRVGWKEFAELKDCPEHFPIIDCQDLFRQQLRNGDIITIDFSGIDRLTDAFFRLLADQKMCVFPALTKVLCTGCIHLTDKGVQWMMLCFKDLKEVVLSGCRQLTETSLAVILANYHSLMTLDMTATRVAVLSRKIDSKSRVSLKLHGCPLITPTLGDHLKYGNRYFEEKSSELKPLTEYKVTIWTGAGFPCSLAQCLLKGTWESNQTPILAYKAVTLNDLEGKDDEKTNLNFFEVKGERAEVDMFLGHGSILVLPFLLTDTLDLDLVCRFLSQMVARIYSRNNPNGKRPVVILAGIRPPGETTADSSTEKEMVKKIENQVKSQIQGVSDLMMLDYWSLTEKKWIIRGMNFTRQQEFGRLALRQEQFASTEKICSVFLDASTPESRQELQKLEFVRNALNMLQKKNATFRSDMSPEFHQVAAVVSSSEPCSFMDLKNKVLAGDLKEVFTPAALERVIEACHYRGMCFYQPSSSPAGGVVISDSERLAKLLSQLIEGAPSKTGSPGVTVHSLGDGAPCWTESALTAAVKDTMGTSLEPSDVIKMLVKSSVLMVVACDRQNASEERYVYLPMSTLPSQPHIELTYLWPDDLPDGDLQVERFFSFPHGMPMSFLPTVLRHFGKISRFNLLWKYGAVIQLGAVDLLVELRTNAQDIQVIMIIARAPKPIKDETEDKEFPSDNDYQAKTNGEECAWGVLNTYSNIVSYLLKKFNIYAKLTVPCKTCIPTRNHKTILFDKMVHHVALAVAATAHEGTLRCRGHCTMKGDQSILSRRDLLGPPAARFSPGHNQIIVDRTNAAPVSKLRPRDKMIQYTKCFQCQNCVEHGVGCCGNSLNGKTARNCDCDTTLALCPECGVCPRCTGYLVNVETTLLPGFSTSSPFKCEVDPLETPFNPLRGNIADQGASRESVVCQCQEMLSVERVNSFTVTLLRGKEANIRLQCSDPNTALFCEYSLGSGILNFVENGKTTKEARCHPASFGDSIELQMRYPTDGCCEYKVGSTVQLTISLNGGLLYSWTTPYMPLLPSVELPEPGSVMLNIPGYWSQSKFPDAIRTSQTRLPGLADIGSPSQDQVQPKFVLLNAFQLPPLAGELANRVTTLNEFPGTDRDRHIWPLGTLNRDLEDDPDFQELLRVGEILPWRNFPTSQKNVIPPDLYLRESLEADCSSRLMTPASVHCQLAQRHSMIARQLFQQGTVCMSGAAVALLPKVLNPKTMTHVRRSDISQLDDMAVHPLCYIRGDVGEILVLPPSYEMTDDSAPYWQVHFVEGEGITPPRDLVEKHLPLLVGWHSWLALDQEIYLPSRPLKGVDDISMQKISLWVHQVIQLQTSFLLMSADSVESVLKHLDVKESEAELQSSVDEITTFVESHLDQTGLIAKVPSLATEALLICQGHANSNFVDCGLDEFPIEMFSSLSHVVGSLQLEGNDLTKLPEDFFKCFTGLIDLDLTQNQLTSLPLGIGFCKKLKFVRFSHNLLTDLPADFHDVNTSLVRVDISANPMDQVPAVITKLTNLRRLYLQYMLLTELPSDIGHLSNLEYFHLAGNCLRRLPKSFVKLQKLKVLGINGVAWYELKFANTYLSKERMQEKFVKRYNLGAWLDRNEEARDILYSFFDQDADEKQLGKLNAHLYAMFPRLGHYGGSVNLSPYRKLGGFPKEILSLRKLEYLSLQYQGLTFIPPAVQQITTLEEVNFAHNPYLTSLTETLGNLPLKRLEVEDCPSLKTPPREIQARGVAGVLAYLRRLQSGSVRCKRTKLMLVGLGGAGKTSLVKTFMADASQGQNLNQDITDGIDISTWTLGRKDGQSVTFSVWDFAGQTVYYNTHQFFLSNRAVYLLVWNIRLGHEHAGLNFWLSSISVHAPNAPIFVVGTHLDQVSKAELPMEVMRERYPQIVGFHFVSSQSRQGIPELESSMLNTALQQQYMGEMIPEVWLKFETAVINHRSKDSVIPYKQLETLASNSGIFEKTEVVQAVQFLHELGTLQHFTNEFLRDQVVIDPQWIVDVMACVVSVKDSPIKDGRFLHSQVSSVWKDYPEALHQWLLRLTEEFDLTFPLPDQQLNIVPCLLSEKQPKIEWPEVEPNNGIRQTKMLYKFDYLPAGLFNRAQVRLYQFSDSSTMWKRGSLLKKNGHLALLCQQKDSELLVQVQGPRPENVLFLVHEVFEGLMSESFQGVTYDYLLPCPDCLQAHSKDPFMFSASTIKRATELRAPFLQCTKLFHAVTLPDLHSIMPPTNNKDYDVHLANAVRGLTDLRRQLVTDIFISYSADDLTGRAGSCKVNPEQIHSDLAKAGYRCYFPKDPRKVNEEQTIIAMRDAQVFMALISDAYVNDKQCCDLLTYAYMTLKKPLILVVLGGGYDWRKSRVGILLSDEVFVNMQKEELYDSRFNDLVKQVQEKSAKDDNVSYPPCFISYCWQNSKLAVSLGTRKVEGAVGYGDPRQLKEHLSKHGVECWLDVERAGKRGLFEDIAEGLRHAQVVVACVSDQYARSPNCVMEYRFASGILKIPTVLAIVGTGNSWRSSEVGMLSLQNPQSEISFQEKHQASFDKLLKEVRSRLKAKTEDDQQRDKSTKKTSSIEELDNTSFQELFELAQRKLLRQVSQYAETSGELYPRLVVVDFLEMTKEQDKAVPAAPPAAKTKPPLKKRPSSGLKAAARDISLRQKSMGFKILCEHEEGWHNYTEPIQAPGHFDESHLGRYSPYLARILALLQHSNQLYLGCTSGKDGQSFLQWLEELPQASLPDFGDTYREFRKEVMSADADNSMGRLARCHMPSGKVMWLCPEHQKVSRVTILANDVILPSSQATAEVGKDSPMVELLHSDEMVKTLRRNMELWPDAEAGKEDGDLSDEEKAEHSRPSTSNSKTLSTGKRESTTNPEPSTKPTAKIPPQTQQVSQNLFKSGAPQSPTTSAACAIL